MLLRTRPSPPWVSTLPWVSIPALSVQPCPECPALPWVSSPSLGVQLLLALIPSWGSEPKLQSCSHLLLAAVLHSCQAEQDFALEQMKKIQGKSHSQQPDPSLLGR